MKKRRKRRRCRCCGVLFHPDPRVANQHFCGNEKCQRASHRQSARKYRRKIKSDDPVKYKIQCQESIERVQEWRKSHPFYWRREKSEKKSDESDALRDLIRVEIDAKTDVLRDLIIRHGFIVKGLTGALTDALRDEIDIQLNCFYDRGLALSSERNVKLKKEGSNYDPKENHQSGSATPSSGGVRLGGSPPGS